MRLVKIDSMKLTPARRIRGTIRLAGDKSISHRAALIAALATGVSHLANFSTSSDCTSTLTCLRQLGVKIDRNVNDVRIVGNGIGGLSAPKEPLDCGNSGSTMRMLAGILAGHDFNSTLTGDVSLLARPMRRVIDPLVKMGARITSEADHPPLSINGRAPLYPLSYELPVASAQLKTCLLFAGLHAEGLTDVKEETGLTRDHTELMLQWFGAPIKLRIDSKHSNIIVTGRTEFQGRDVRIPGDFSSSAFLIGAAALLPDSQLDIERLGLNPTRTQLLETLRIMGVNIEILNSRIECNEPSGKIRVQGIPTNRAVGGPNHIIDGPVVAALIDELPLLAVIGSQISGGLIIKDARELRFKETDRIAATVANLRAMGAQVEELEDGLRVDGPVRLRGATIDPRGDHRIAMAFSIAALVAEGDTELTEPESVAVSFPEFFTCLASVVER